MLFFEVAAALAVVLVTELVLVNIVAIAVVLIVINCSSISNYSRLIAVKGSSNSSYTLLK